MLLGTYEQACLPWSPRQTPWDFSMRLLPSDLDRIADALEVAFAHFPALGYGRDPAGGERSVHVRARRQPANRAHPGSAWVLDGLRGDGRSVPSAAAWDSRWPTGSRQSDPGFDVWAMDVARFGDHATLAYTNTKVRENYARRFRITFPNEFLPEGRRVQTSPIYDRLADANAVWGDSFGLESALWFQKDGLEPVEEVTFGRSNAWDRVRAETLAVRAAVGMMETTGFAKFLVQGPRARAWLDRLLAGRIPVPGRMALTPMTNPAGNLAGDLTVACLPAALGRAEGPAGTVVGGVTGNVRVGEQFVLFGSGIAERYYERWFDDWLPQDGSVSYQTLGAEMCGLAIAGPASRALLAEVTDADVSAHGMRFMAFAELDLGLAPVWCGRISFTGDLGYELWMPARYQRYVFDLLREAGTAHGLELFGLHALNSLRLEKGFGSWVREYRPDYDPFEAGLGRFVRMEKDFVGRDALAAKHGESGPPGEVAATGLRLCTWTVETEPGRAGFDVIGDEPVWHDGEVVGWVTSGGYAHHSEVSVAMGYVPAELADSPGRFEIEIVGTRRRATLVPGCLWDPESNRMRG